MFFKSKVQPSKYQDQAQKLFSLGDVRIDGNRPWDIQVTDDRFYPRILAEGSLGLGESYMDAWWSCERLDEFFHRIIRAGSEHWIRKSAKFWWIVLNAIFQNRQSRDRVEKVVHLHYDLDNELYQKMLDQRMAYTCAYWEGANTLEEAQEKKLDLVCRKIGLQPGMKVLDLGCGWGSFAKFAAEKYCAQVVGVNLSKEQIALGQELCRGLPVELRTQDYREVEGKFDRVVSIGIMEHIGHKNHKTYMDVVDRCLAPDGIAFIHTIGNNKPYVHTDPWFHKYIFPNAVIPCLSQISRAMEGRFVVEDLHNIGPHYDRTLMAWNERFQTAWPELKKRYSDRFKRMWEYYLLCSAGSFRARNIQLWQIVMTRVGTPQPPCRFS
jgi:cyclopropane-fatty-acyl-phospholipid synthase